MARAGERWWKRPDDVFLAGLDFTAWPIQEGETIVAANSRGALSVTAEDEDGADVSAQIVEGPPAILSSGVAVAFVVKGGTVGAVYWITVTAPTTDDELMTDRQPLEVRETYRG